MRIKVFMDDKPCMATISRWNWTRTLLSMIIHANEPQHWRWFITTNNDHPTYKGKEIHILPQDIDWEWLDREGFNLWLKSYGFDGIENK